MSANPVISAERLEEIRTLRAGITPGPWTVADSFRADQALALVACEDGLVRGVISPKPPFKTAHNNLKFIATAPQIADDCLALAEENARLRKRELLLWRWAYSLNLVAARTGLALRNAEQREAGETNNWPAQSEWHELVSSSHSVFTRAARELAGIDHDAFLAFVRGEHGADFLIAAEELYEAAIDAARLSSDGGA